MIDEGLIFRTPTWVLCLVVLACLTASIELGFRLGTWARTQRPESEAMAGIGTMEAAIFGLFGLLLALTFSFVVSRVDARRHLLVVETNAIGTAYLRFDILPDAPRTALRAQLRDYVDQRVALVKAAADPARAEGADVRAAALQASMWAIAATEARARPDAASYGLVLAALNDVFDEQASHDAAVRAHLQPPVLGFLALTAMVASTVAGYALGLAGRRHRVATTAFIVLTSLVAFMILDLDRPQRGLFRAPTAALLELQRSLHAGAP